jgi:NADP-dependent 3-hydroxy acid dehydrogenase YdfG
MQSLKDKVVVITGASQGLGAAIARHMAAEQARLVLTARNKKKLEEVAQSLNLSKGNFAIVTADITRASGIKKIVNTAYKEFGRVDVFINNAGIGLNKLFIRMSEKEFDTILNTNLKSVFYSFQELLPRFQKQDSGTIINVSSMAGKQGVPGMSAYSTSKAAMNILSESVAGEVRNENIKICVFAPASMDTNFGSNYQPRSRTPSRAKKKLTIDEVAEAIVFIAKQNKNVWTSMTEIRPLLINK